MNEGRRTFLFLPNRASDTVPAPLGEKAKLRGRPSSHMINERVDQSVPSRFVPCIWAGAWVLSLTFSLRFFPYLPLSLSPLCSSCFHFLFPLPERASCALRGCSLSASWARQRARCSPNRHHSCSCDGLGPRSGMASFRAPPKSLEGLRGIL